MGLLNGNLNLVKPEYDHYVWVSEDSVTDDDTFKNYISLFNLKINRRENGHYILYGENISDIDDFITCWNSTE